MRGQVLFNNPSNSAQKGRNNLMKITIISFVLIFPVLMTGYVDGDGCYIPAVEVDIYEPGQNAVISWDGQTERLYLSVDIYGNEGTDGFHVVPLPSEPEISLGDISIFSKLNDLVQDDWVYIESDDYSNSNAYSGGGADEEKKVVVTQQKQIGEHDITIIKVIDPDDFKEQLLDIVEDTGIDIQKWPDGLNDIIETYTRKGIDYFSVDHYAIKSNEASIKPVIYEFESDAVFFPLQISSILEAGTKVTLGIVHPPHIELDMTCFKNSTFDTYIKKNLDRDDLKDLDENILNHIGDEATLTFFQFKTNLKDLKGDVVLPALRLVTGISDPKDFSFPIWRIRGGYKIHETKYAFIIENSNDGQILCINGIKNNIEWNMSLDEGIEILKRTMLEVEGHQGEYYPIIMDTIDHRTNHFRKIFKIDPENGDIVWSVHIDNYADSPREFRTIADENGKKHILVGVRDNMTIINMNTGEIEKKYSEFWDLNSYPRHFVSTDNGDRIIFHGRDRLSYCFDPFLEGLPQYYSPYSNSTVNYNMEDLTLASFNVGIIHVFESNNTLLGLSYGNYSGRNLFDLWDLNSGEHLDLLNLSFMGSIIAIPKWGDLDLDGVDEVLFLHWGLNYTGEIYALSLEFLTFTVDFDVVILTEYNGEIEWKIVDFCGDGDLDLLVRSGYETENIVIEEPIGVLDIWNGSVIFKGKTGIDPFERIGEGSVVLSLFIRLEDGRFSFFNHEKGILEPFELDIPDRYEDTFEQRYIYYLDFDGDLNKEILILKNSNSQSFRQIYYVDPDSDTAVYEECIYGYSHPIVSVDSGEGDSLIFVSKNMFYWISGDIDDSRGPVQVLDMDQENVEIRLNPADDDDGIIQPDDMITFIIAIIFLLTFVIIFLVVMYVVKISKSMKRSKSQEK